MSCSGGEGYARRRELPRAGAAHALVHGSTELPGEALLLELESEPFGRMTITGALRSTNFTSLLSEDRLRFCWGLDRSRPDTLIMPQGLAVYEWDGEQGAGMIERSVPVADLPGGVR